MSNEGRRKTRVPELTWELLRPHDDIGSPVGTWAMDEGISELIDTGLLKYPEPDWCSDRKDVHWYLRPQLRQAALNAHSTAWAKQRHVDSRAERVEEMQQLRRLETELQIFLERRGSEMELAKEFTTDERIQHLPDHTALTSGLKFATQLSGIIRRREMSLRPSNQPNADFMMQDFVREMRFCWFFLTKRDPPKTGGKILIKLAAGTWRDSKLPINFNEEDLTLEDWMAERFKALSARG